VLESLVLLLLRLRKRRRGNKEKECARSGREKVASSGRRREKRELSQRANPFFLTHAMVWNGEPEKGEGKKKKKKRMRARGGS